MLCFDKKRLGLHYGSKSIARDRDVYDHVTRCVLLHSGLVILRCTRNRCVLRVEIPIGELNHVDVLAEENTTVVSVVFAGAIILILKLGHNVTPVAILRTDRPCLWIRADPHRSCSTPHHPPGVLLAVNYILVCYVCHVSLHLFSSTFLLTFSNWAYGYIIANRAV